MSPGGRSCGLHFKVLLAGRWVPWRKKNWLMSLFASNCMWLYCSMLMMRTMKATSFQSLARRLNYGLCFWIGSLKRYTCHLLLWSQFCLCTKKKNRLLQVLCSNVVKLKDRVTNVEKLFTQSEIEGQPSEDRLSLMKPIIIMPKSSHSTE